MNDEFQEGATLAGKYRIDRVLGVGGMGVVVAAHHLELDDKVAIKFLLPETLANPEAVARFAREARAAVKIKSEHVARVSDVGKLDNGAPYMVMEYLEGSDLSQWLAERGPLPVEQAVDFILQASEAIAEAHSLGIVHRDLKPANLFAIRRAGVFSIKVLDFGISKMTGLSASGSNASMTRTSTMMGSPLYMSPEQVRSSKDVDWRADIWALGVILYELIAGAAPFEAEHMAELVYRIISVSPTALRARRPDVPEGIDAVVALCLAKEREARFASVAEMARALLPFASRRAAASVERITGIASGGHVANDSATAVPLTRTAESSAGAGTAASWGTTAVEKRRKPWLFVSGVVLSMAIASVAAIKHFAFSASAPSAAVAVAVAPPAHPVVHAPPSPKPEPPVIAPEATPAPAPAETASAVASARRKAQLPMRSAAVRSPELPNAKPIPKSDTPFDQWGESRH